MKTNNFIFTIIISIFISTAAFASTCDWNKGWYGDGALGINVVQGGVNAEKYKNRPPQGLRYEVSLPAASETDLPNMNLYCPIGDFNNICSLDDENKEGKKDEDCNCAKKGEPGKVYLKTLLIAKKSENYYADAKIILKLSGSEQEQAILLDECNHYVSEPDNNKVTIDNYVVCHFYEDKLPDVSTKIESAYIEMPAGVLSCNNGTNMETSIIPVRVPIKNGVISRVAKDLPEIVKVNDFFKRARHPWSNSEWTKDVKLSKPERSEDGKDITFDYKFEKKFQSEEYNLGGFEDFWDVTLDGHFSTAKDTYFDVQKLDLRYKHLNTKFGKQDSFLKRTEWSAFIRSESTHDGDDFDYIGGIGWGARLGVIDLPFVTKNRVQPYPYINIGYERADPNKRNDGMVPDNYNRIFFNLNWRFYITSSAAIDLEAGIIRNANYNDPDLSDWERKLDVTLKIQSQNEWSPFIKYSHGSEGPDFKLFSEVLIGIEWTDFLQ